jgi:hypothetical protein
MHLIVLGSCSMSPFVIEIENMDALIPVEQVITDKEISVGSHATQVIFSGVADTPSISYSLQHRVLVVKRLLRNCGKGEEKIQEGTDQNPVPKGGESFHDWKFVKKSVLIVRNPKTPPMKGGVAYCLRED